MCLSSEKKKDHKICLVSFFAINIGGNDSLKKRANRNRIGHKKSIITGRAGVFAKKKKVCIEVSGRYLCSKHREENVQMRGWEV